MHKKSEELMDKHLSQAIYRMVSEVCERKFDEVFEERCTLDNENDTTIGATMRILEAMALEVVEDRLENQIKEISDEMEIVNATTTFNPYAKIAYLLWHEFLYYHDIKGYVENAIGDEWGERQEALTKNGVLDEHGDYIATK